MGKFLKKLIGDGRGAAAVEFALLLPLMMVLLTGIIELTNLMMAQRKMLNTVHTIGDLIAQETELTSADLNDIFSAGALILAPFPDDSFAIGVASVVFDSSAVASVDWTSSLNSGVVINPTSSVASLAVADESVIMISGSYSYTPLLSMILPGPIQFSETVFLRPRKVSSITLN